MRPYRATPIDKPVDSGEFVYGWYSECWSASSGYNDIGSHIRWLDKEGNFHEEEVHRSTVGQQVGLKDKHGKEIYDRDIFQGLRNFAEAVVSTYCIFWDVKNYAWRASKYKNKTGSIPLTDFVWLEIISTVHNEAKDES